MRRRLGSKAEPRGVAKGIVSDLRIHDSVNEQRWKGALMKPITRRDLLSKAVAGVAVSSSAVLAGTVPAARVYSRMIDRDPITVTAIQDAISDFARSDTARLLYVYNNFYQSCFVEEPEVLFDVTSIAQELLSRKSTPRSRRRGRTSFTELPNKHRVNVFPALALIHSDNYHQILTRNEASFDVIREAFQNSSEEELLILLQNCNSSLIISAKQISTGVAPQTPLFHVSIEDFFLEVLRGVSERLKTSEFLPAIPAALAILFANQERVLRSVGEADADRKANYIRSMFDRMHAAGNSQFGSLAVELGRHRDTNAPVRLVPQQTEIVTSHVSALRATNFPRTTSNLVDRLMFYYLADLERMQIGYTAHDRDIRMGKLFAAVHEFGVLTWIDSVASLSFDHSLPQSTRRFIFHDLPAAAFDYDDEYRSSRQGIWRIASELPSVHGSEYWYHGIGHVENILKVAGGSAAAVAVSSFGLWLAKQFEKDDKNSIEKAKKLGELARENEELRARVSELEKRYSASDIGKTS